ncbi:MAG: hypothetical protein RLO18_24550 [Gimesia chilikensis]
MPIKVNLFSFGDRSALDKWEGLVGIEDQMQETSGVSLFFIKTCIPIDRSANCFSVLEMGRDNRALVKVFQA